MNRQILELNGMHIYNSDRSVCLLNDVNLAIKENEFYVVLGGNGAGKSTLLYAMQGEVNRHIVEGERKTDLSYIPLLTQQVEHYFVGETAWEEFVLTLEANQPTGMAGADHVHWLQHEIDRVVNLLDLQSVLYKPLQHLSGGQLQLVALASLLLIRSSLILIDEMTTMLDAFTRKTMLKRIRQIQKQTACTIVYVTHVAHEVEPTDHIIHIKDKHVTVYKNGQITADSISEVNDIANNTNSDQLLNKSISNIKKNSQIDIDHIKVKYNQQALVQTHNFKAQRLTYIKGNNGVGKSTLLKAIAGELELASGEIKLDKTFIAKRHSNGTKFNRDTLKHISYCPQFLQYTWSKDCVLEECLFAMKCSNIILSTNDLKEHISAYLRYFYIDEELYEREIYSLSAGQQRRLALAICFMVETNWILLDEPYAYLDDMTCRRLSTLIEVRVKQGCGVLLVSHEQPSIALEKDKVEYIEIVKQDNIDTIKTEQQSKKIEQQSENKSSLLYLFHPGVLLLSILILSIVLFLYANIAELIITFIIALIINSLVLKGRVAGLFKLVIMYSLFIGLLACFSALRLPQWTIDLSHMQQFLLYGYKLLTMILLSFSLFELVSPFRLMRILQQAVSKVKGSQATAIKLYIIVIIFRFMTILQQLWGTLVKLYRVKYKRYVYEAPIAFLTHFLRETLFIAEAIIINYEIRQPLQLTTVIYKVKMKAVDYLLLAIILMCSALIFLL